LLSCRQGAQGERLRGTSVWAAHALRASGSYLLSLAGDKPPEARALRVGYGLAGPAWVVHGRCACVFVGVFYKGFF